MKTTLLLATWDEIEGMRAIMPQIRRDWVDQILVLDGGSTDGTLEYAQSLGLETYVQKRKGLHRAYEEIWDRIRGDVVITFSPDGNSVADIIPELVDTIKRGYDMVIVSRYLKWARSADDDFLTGFGNKLFTGLINLLYQAHYTDAMGIYRAYRTDLPKRLGLMGEAPYAPMEQWLNTAISWEPLLSVRAAKRRLRMAEIPGDEPPRIGGARKMRIVKWGIAYMAQILREFFL